MSHYRDILARFEISDCPTFEAVKRKFPDQNSSFLKKLIYLKGLRITEDGRIEKTGKKIDVAHLRSNNSSSTSERERIENNAEIERLRNGMIKLVDQSGNEKWCMIETAAQSLLPKLKEWARREQIAEIKWKNVAVFLSTEEIVFPDSQTKIRLINWLFQEIQSTTERKTDEKSSADEKGEKSEEGLTKFVDATGQERWISTEQAKELKSASVFPYGTSTQQLGQQIADYVRQTSRDSLFDIRQVKRLFRGFWIQKYPSLIRWAIANHPVKLKIQEAEQLALRELEDEKRPHFESLVQKLIQWGLEKNLMRITRSDVKLFLLDSNIRVDVSSERMLYRAVKLKYRYLPPWMREKK